MGGVAALQRALWALAPHAPPQKGAAPGTPGAL
jgi:hypothetical protein